MLKLENIYFSYDKGKEVLKNISIDIEKGKKIIFLGENGSGKSTLFFLLNGILKKDSGDIFLENKKIKYKKKDLDELRRKVGVVFQDPDIQIFAPTVFQEIAYGLENIGFSINEIESKVEKILKELELNDLKENPCHHLSYGQKKRVSIASIVAMNPEVLVLDEPTAWLDPKNIKKITDILEDLNKKGKTIIISTHDIDFAYDIADYIYILHNGIILKKGSRDEIFEDFEFFKKLNFNIPNKLKIKKFLNKKDINIEEYDKFLKENF
ncbi:MAG: ABC transporter ATP-binding protein [Leptotrichiaceae bacterium]|nr:ABC transporter ATP-binding protein [Leptotrichiaceae bacterium]MBP7100969.1 ABC transporter ATP-binding protein [Leptotrichiaceae bacterium]MBP9629405.1 ABC transporter ATP-binding protein [Leptotrichiaceae bacterium]